MLQHRCSLSKYVILSSICKPAANVVASMCPQNVCDLVEYLKHSTNVVVPMWPQMVHDLVQHLKAIR
jgi:hypothetical protein